MSELKNHLQPYVNFWCAWIKSDECFLSAKEIAIINNFTLNNFSVKNANGVSDETINEVDEIINKLKNGFVKFQLWMAYIFITAILRMANENGGTVFFQIAINELPLSNELKNILVGFNIDTLNGIFENYNPDDFSKNDIYLKIIECEGVLNLEKKSLFKKTQSLPQNQYAQLYLDDP